jgi:DNA-binding GntR family transcriptional regulator
MESKYQDIYDSLLKRIKNGIYEVGSMIPTERELTQEFSVTRNTVRRAIDELINGGYLYRKPASGAFVCGKSTVRSLSRQSICEDNHFYDEFGERNTKVIDFHIFDKADVHKEILGLKSNAKIYHLRRIQYGNGKPIVYESFYFPCAYFTKIPKDECMNSLDDIIKKHARFDTVKRTKKTIVEAKSSTKQISSYLQISTRDPLLKVKILVSVNKKAYYYFTETYPGNEYDFLAE